MLILTRRTTEVIYIGEGENQVEVAVLGIKGNQVRLGIEAPKHITIHREEVRQRISDDNPRGKSRSTLSLKK